jgi:hypothetical protein
MSTDLKFKATLDNSSFKKGMAENVDATKRLDSAFDGLTSKIAAGFGIERLAEKGLSMISEFGKSVFEATANYEKFSARLSILLGGNKEEAGALYEQFVKFSSLSGIKLADVENAGTQLINFGLAPGKVTSSLEMLGEMSVKSGQDLDTLAKQYGFAIEKGALNARQLRQWQKEGIDVPGQIRKDLNMSAEAFAAYSKKHEITATQLTTALTELANSTGYKGQLAALAETTTGQLNKISTQWEELLVNVGKSTTGIVHAILSIADKVLGALGKDVEAKNFISDAGIKQGLLGDPETIAKALVIESKLHEITEGENADKKIAVAIRGFEKLISDINKAEQGKMAQSDVNSAEITKSLYVQAIKQLKINQDLNKAPGTTSERKDAAITPISEKEKVRENITFNITKLVETLSIHSVNLKEGADEIKKIVSDTLQTVVYGVKNNMAH